MTIAKGNKLSTFFIELKLDRVSDQLRVKTWPDWNVKLILERKTSVVCKSLAHVQRKAKEST